MSGFLYFYTHKASNSLNNLYLCRGNGFLSKVSSDFGTTHFVFMLMLFLAEPVF